MAAGRCSSCSSPLDGAGRYCKACHARYMRIYRARSKVRPLAPRETSVGAYDDFGPVLPAAMMEARA